MAVGMYVAEKRVERDGVLICFQGERMTMAEARRRGLLGHDEAEPEVPEPGTEPVETDAERVKALVDSNKLDELQVMADERGIAYPKGATKAVIAEAIVASERAEVSEG